MPSFYFVAQYVPDQVADERINFGVFACGEGRTLYRFLRDWRRVEAFADGGPTGFLREFAADAASWDEVALRECAAKWRHSIQITPARGSLLPPESLLERMARAFLREPRPAERVAEPNRPHALEAVPV
jgi:hypothetical protein